MEPNGIFELTILLTTGRPSDALADLLAGGGKLSERVGVQGLSIRT